MPYTENYNTDPAVAYEGMVADLGAAVIVSRTVQAAALGFGKAVKVGTLEHTVKNVEAGDTVVYGLSVRSQATPAGSPNAYPVGDTAAILLKGVIWVKVGIAVAKDDPVYVTVADGTFKKAAGAGNVLVADATYETAASLNGLARVRIL